MIAAALLLAAQPPPPGSAAAQAAAAAAADAAADYAECARRECATPRDAQASIAHAEAQFRLGDYDGALRTLTGAVARTRGAAAASPRPVAALWSALALVALHRGDLALYRDATEMAARLLLRNLPADNPAAAAAALSLGEMWIKLGDAGRADAAYRAAAHRARRAGLASEEAVAQLHRAWLAAQAGQPRTAEHLLAQVAAGPPAAAPEFAAVVPYLRRRIAAESGGAADVEALVAEGARHLAGEPELQWQARLEPLPGRAPARAWADIGFRIAPDGCVADAAVLRGAHAGAWIDAVLRQLATRRYAMPAHGAGGTYRVERFSLSSGNGGVSGRSSTGGGSAPRIEVVDLSCTGALTSARC